MGKSPKKIEARCISTESGRQMKPFRRDSEVQWRPAKIEVSLGTGSIRSSPVGNGVWPPGPVSTLMASS